jgi:hypothetical protein
MKASRAARLAAFCAALAAAGCENDHARLGLTPELPPPGVPVSLERDIQPIFDMNCALGGCHAEPDPQEGMSLEEGRIFSDVVGIGSSQAPPLLRIESGRSDRSYLINKLEGTQGSVGGFGQQMPRFAPPLDAETIQAIREWIDQGAQDN